MRFGVDVCRPSDHEEMQRVETIGEQAKRFNEGLSPARLAAPLGWLGINVLSWVGIVDESFPFLLSLVLPLLMWQSLGSSCCWGDACSQFPYCGAGLPVRCGSPDWPLLEP